jgi:signal recognition particle GTPase
MSNGQNYSSVPFDLDEMRKWFEVAKDPERYYASLRSTPGMEWLADTIKKSNQNANTDEGISRVKGIFDSMTADERRNPEHRRDLRRHQRISAGAGVELHEIRNLLDMYQGIADLFDWMSKMPPKKVVDYFPPEARPFRIQ